MKDVGKGKEGRLVNKNGTFEARFHSTYLFHCHKETVDSIRPWCSTDRPCTCTTQPQNMVWKKKSVPCPWYLLCFVQRVFICLSLLPDHIKMLYIDAELFCHTFWSFWQFDSLYCLDKLVTSPSVIGVMDLFINCCPQSFTINCFSLTQKQSWMCINMWI